MHTSMSRDPAAILKQVGSRVRALRNAHDMPRRELALRSGLSERFLAQVEAGKGNIAVSRLCQLAQCLGVRPGALLDAAPQQDSRQGGALLGVRGAGKTTLGRAAAEALNVAFIEHDRVVEEEAGMDLAEVFAMHGDGYYRKVVRDTLDRLLAGVNGPTILATGGGVVTDMEAYDLLRRRSHTVWLQASVDDHWARVVAQGDGRPMRDRPDARAELARLLERRIPLYERADYVIDTSSGSRDGAVGAVSHLVGQVLGLDGS